MWGDPATCYLTYLGPPPPCKQALRIAFDLFYSGTRMRRTMWQISSVANFWTFVMIRLIHQFPPQSWILPYNAVADPDRQIAGGGGASRPGDEGEGAGLKFFSGLLGLTWV